MITTITIITALVVINFSLLAFSCNKAPKRKLNSKKPHIIKHTSSTKSPIQLQTGPLAATGS